MTKEECQMKIHGNKTKGSTEKSLHDKFKKSNEGIAVKQLWQWLKMGCMKKGTEAIITTAQDQALQTNWIEDAIDEQHISLKCTICQTENESGLAK